MLCQLEDGVKVSQRYHLLIYRRKSEGGKCSASYTMGLKCPIYIIYSCVLTRCVYLRIQLDLEVLHFSYYL